MDLKTLSNEARSGRSIVESVGGAIQFVNSVSDPSLLQECKAQAAAVSEYLSHRMTATIPEHNAALKIRMCVDHRLGEVLAETVRAGKPNCDTVSQLPQGIPRKQSSRAQQLAALPWCDIEAAIDTSTKSNTKAAQSRILKSLLQDDQRKKNADLVSGVVPISDVLGEFSTIVVDPPWDWGDEGDVSQFGRGRHEYQAMPFSELLEFPVWERAAANCHMYLWITNRSLPKGFSLLDAWGFRYVTCLTWCKPSIGMGNYYRGSTEHVLFGVRGSLALLKNNVGTWFQAGRSGPHSTKPAEFYDMVEVCSPGPWLDVFSRRERPGWTTWGAEVP